MRRIFRRSILWLLPVIVIPVVALLVMQYRTLRELEKKTASAEHNRVRGAVEDVAFEIESYYRTAAQRSLSVGEGVLRDPAGFAKHLAANPIGGAKTYFTVDFTRPIGMNWFDARGASASMPAIDEREAVKLATVSWHVAYKLQRVVPQRVLNVDERDKRHRVIMLPVTDPSMRVVGVAGAVLDEERAKSAMGGLAARTMKRHLTHQDMALRISDTFPRMPDGRNFVTQSLGFVFTDWRAGLRDACASPEEIAACSFRLNMTWTGVMMLLFVGSVALAIHSVLRQARVSQMKSDFVSNVSHELRTPLSSIRVFGEYMRLGRVQKAEKVREYGEYIEVESRRLTQLINNILDFSKIESEEKKYRFSEVDVIDLVRQTVGAHELPLRDQGFVLRFHAPAGPAPLLDLDKDAIGQVLANLLDNAVKYSGERKEIDVRVTFEMHSVRISVRDRGIGIPPAEQKKIFEKFYRVGSGLVHDVKGSGLGLAIVKHVVRAHGGHVELTSAPGEGSTFTIILPAVRGDGSVSIPRTEYA